MTHTHTHVNTPVFFHALAVQYAMLVSVTHTHTHTHTHMILMFSTVCRRGVVWMRVRMYVLCMYVDVRMDACVCVCPVGGDCLPRGQGTG